MEQSSNPVKDEIWELRTKGSHEDTEKNLYYFVGIGSVSATIDGGDRKVHYYPFELKSGSIYRCILTKKLEDFLSLYEKKTGISWWPNRVITVPKFVTIPSMDLESIKKDIETLPEPSAKLEKAVNALAEHFEPKRLEYDVLRKRVNELKDDLLLYDEFRRIL